MGDKSWKRLERDVAEYFGTSRRLRGADFGTSDIEILAVVKEWLPELPLSDKLTLAVECKYRKAHPIVDLVHENIADGPSMVRVGDYILMRLEDFKFFFKVIVLPWPHLNVIDALTWDNRWLNKKVPKYLDEYRAQAVQYTAHEDMVLLPLVCMAQANTKGKVIAVHTTDIKSFAKAHELLNKKARDDKARVSQTFD
jgi:hypothetical protein